MHEVRLARGASLAFMMFQGIVVGFLDNGQIVLRTVLLNPLHQLAELGERESGGRDLLAQARHVGLYPAERAKSEGGQPGRRSIRPFGEGCGRNGLSVPTGTYRCYVPTATSMHARRVIIYL